MNGDEYPHVPAAFINALAEEGTKDEAIAFLQKQWNETCALRAKLRDTPCDAQSVEPEMPRHAPQTIETAPRDGTHILAWRIPIGIRVTNNTNPPTVVHWFDDPDEPGFYTSVNERAPEHPFNPTHWERLPDPPLSLTREDRDSKATEVADRWPLGCHSPNSCSRNGRCMYVRCKHDGKDIAALASAFTSASRRAPILEATPAQHWDLPKGKPAQFVRDGKLETCECFDCRALTVPSADRGDGA